MNIKSYINRNAFPNSIPGDRNSFICKIKEGSELRKLIKFDKIINAIWEMDENADVCFIADLFHASYNIGDRWFVIDQNPNNTYTLQENVDEDIIYIVDGCRYQKVLAKKVLQYLKNL